MADNIVGGLFGMTPELLQAQRNAQLEQQAANFVNNYGDQGAMFGYKLGSTLGRGIGGMLGAQDPEMMRIQQRQQMLQGLDMNDPQSLMKAAQAANQAGDTAAAQELYAKAQQAAQAQATLGKTQAQAAQEQFNLNRQQRLEAALAALPPGSTDQDKMDVITRFGGADKLLTVLQGKQNIDQQIEARREAATQAIEARKEAARQSTLDRLELARVNGANQLQLAEIARQGRIDIARLTAELRPPSPAVLKAQADADAKAAGQEGLQNTIDTAKTLINDLSKAEGMTGTSRSSLANLFTSLSTTSAGQSAGRMLGTATQSKRDELSSVRLQLFNAIKEATGTSSSQLNSNVELQTWLASLGSAGMTKETNEAILNNIETSYLKKKPTVAPAGEWGIVKKSQ